uniref:Uncharacterized protein n=1 Tax=Hyaloperonospora arabidopsidis (strain Emoy2) TaxID=559515 RepID=M4B391_HYAAE
MWFNKGQRTLQLEKNQLAFGKEPNSLERGSMNCRTFLNFKNCSRSRTVFI